MTSTVGKVRACASCGKRRKFYGSFCLDGVFEVGLCSECLEGQKNDSTLRKQILALHPEYEKSNPITRIARS